MPSTTVAEVLYMPESEAARFLPEGPTALGVGKFSWVAIQHGPEAKVGSLNIFDIDSKTNVEFPLHGRPGFAKPTTQANTFLVGCEHELGLFNTDSGQWQQLTGDVDSDVDGTTINDGTLYANNVVFGTKDLEFKTKKAGLYLYRGDDGKLIRLRDDQICSNGKDVIDSGKGGLFLIDIDTPTKKVVRYKIDIADGSICDEEIVVDFGELDAFPDGMVMTPDEQSLIVSFYNPNPAEYGETRQYSLYSGELEHVYRTPGSPQATCPLLIQVADGSIKLVITTAVEFMPEDRRDSAPNAGALFITDTKFKSPATNPHFPVKANA